jgi:arsenate reductase (glutaredoxin)
MADSADSITLYGIINCDQVRKARAWLKAQGVAYQFHDYRVAGVNQEMLSQWCKTLPWDSLLNKRGTTWRVMPVERRQTAVDQASAIALMLAEPTLIKRPVVTIGKTVLLGFNEAVWQNKLMQKPS